MLPESCPFPGMNPYLEDVVLWPEFHKELVTGLHEILLRGLTEGYHAVVGQRHYFTAMAKGDEEHHESYLEFRHKVESKLVTMLDIVSPTNKTSAEGREAYLKTRQEARSRGASLVEIDLVLQGKPMLDYSREGLPDWDYAVTVTRAAHPERFEIYTATLQKRLPRFRLPLGAGDRDTVIDLQTALARCINSGGYATRIDYSRDPAVPLGEEDRRWLNDLLLAQSLRQPPPPHDEIARLAYQLWEEDGRPHGRDLEHWQKALEQLQQRRNVTSA